MDVKTGELSLAMASKEEGKVLNADDLKLAEMGYKPVSLFHCVSLIVGTFERVFYDVCNGIGL